MALIPVDAYVTATQDQSRIMWDMHNLIQRVTKLQENLSWEEAQPVRIAVRRLQQAQLAYDDAQDALADVLRLAVTVEDELQRLAAIPQPTDSSAEFDIVGRLGGREKEV